MDTFSCLILQAMEEKLIYGIQEVGIGVQDAEEAMNWYARFLGFDVKVFDDSNPAPIMAPYTGGVCHDKRAILMLNSAGGSGLELWQYLDKEPLQLSFCISPGDIGVNYCKIKSNDLTVSFERLQRSGIKILSGIKADPVGNSYFFIQDLAGNPIQIVENNCFYARGKFDLGGVTGCAIGVSDIRMSCNFYAGVLGYTEIIYDEVSDNHELGLTDLHSGRIRRVLLAAPEHSEGRFGRFLGKSQIELIQCLDEQPRYIFENRNWGDLGYIHLCFEVYNLDGWVEACRGIAPFTVLSDENLSVDEADGRLGYLEDPDGTLIEFVETCRIPILKALHWYNNLETKHPEKPLSPWLVKALSLKKIKVVQ